MTAEIEKAGNPERVSWDAGLSSEEKNLTRWSSNRDDWCRFMERRFRERGVPEEKWHDLMVLAEEEKRQVAARDYKAFEDAKEYRKKRVEELEILEKQIGEFERVIPRTPAENPEVVALKKRGVAVLESEIDRITKERTRLQGKIQEKQAQLGKLGIIAKIFSKLPKELEDLGAQERTLADDAERAARDIEIMRPRDLRAEAIAQLEAQPEYVALRARAREIGSTPSSREDWRGMLARHAVFFGDPELDPYLAEDEVSGDEDAEDQDVESVMPYERYIPDDVLLRVVQKNMK